MGLRIISGSGPVDKDLSQTQSNSSYGLEKLSISIQFLKKGMATVEPTVSEQFLAKARELNQYKQNANHGTLLTLFAVSQLNILSNSINRLKEIVAQSLDPALSDKERSYLFVEYQANYEDIVNVSLNSYFMEQQIFNVPNEDNLQIQFKIGNNLNSNDSAAHLIVIEKLNKIKTFPQDLGIPSVRDLICSVSGVAIEDVLEYFDVNETNDLGGVFDIACLQLLDYRKQFEELNTRFNRANQAIQVAYDNAIAAHSTIADLDYAAELTNLAKAKILVLAKNSLIAQSHDLTKQTILTLVDNDTKNNS